MRNSTPTLLLLLAAGCSFPQFVAKKTVTSSRPIENIRELECASHNGDITIEGKPGAVEIRLRVEISVRGTTQAEADANLESLELAETTNADRLTLAGRYPESVSGMSPTFSFVIEGPPQLAAFLESHNGNIRALEMRGALSCETHNGNIEARSTTDNAKLVTHNGDIDAAFRGNGALNGSARSHNGRIAIGIEDGLSTAIDARTTNGRISLLRSASETRSSKDRLECRIGDGGGHLDIETHNGGIVIR